MTTAVHNSLITLTPSSSEVGQSFTITLWSLSSSSGSSSTPGPSSLGAFTVLVSYDDTLNSPVTVLQGVPQSDRIVTAGTERYYQLLVPPGNLEAITISVIPITITGDPDLFINSPSRGDFYHRTRLSSGSPDPAATWSSAHPSGIPDTITINPSDPNHAANGGIYYITVFGFQDAEFTLRGSSASTVVLLQEGASVQGSVNYGSYQYYRFIDSQPDLDTEFDLSPSTGDADLYISCRVNPTTDDSGTPSRTQGHYNYSSVLYQEDTIWVKATDAGSCGKQSNGGVFYLAVLGYTYYQTVSYTLRAMHYGGTKTLVIGRSEESTVYKHLSALYRFRLGKEEQEVTITVMTISGDADVFVRLGDREASMSDFDYRSGNVGTLADVITIPETDVCIDCWVSVLVYGFETSRYAILVTLEDTTVTLSQSTPQQGSVGQNDFQYYISYAPNNGTAIAVLTVFSGAPNIFLSLTDPTPHAVSSTVVGSDSDSTGGLPTVSLGNVRGGQAIYVGVGGGATNSTYTVRVTVDASLATDNPPELLRLVVGLPQVDKFFA